MEDQAGCKERLTGRTGYVYRNSRWTYDRRSKACTDVGNEELMMFSSERGGSGYKYLCADDASNHARDE